MELKDISKKRQKKWKETNLYKVEENTAKPKFYILDMFPYPSGSALHVGHPKGFIATDCLARKKMLEGFNVLHPMGFDTFGLGTEQYAIEHKMKPQLVSEQNIATFIKQLESFGTTYDRSKTVNTADPKYFKWTQRVFLQMYNHYYDEILQKAMPITDATTQQRLAYVDYKPINRCPHCMTGLANEDLDDGKCERCGSAVEQKPMKQRVLRITKYAERLLEGLDTLQREESMKDLERNRIGKSEGTQFTMKIAGTSDEKEGQNMYSFDVYTTRIDTVFGMSFVAIAPEHPLVEIITTAEYTKDIEAYKEAANKKSQLERTELQKEKTGVFCGAYAINPFNGEKVPVFVADYVLANYGTGVVMAVPAHDERDFEFAKKYNLPIKHVIGPSFGEKNSKSEIKTSGYAIIYDKKTDSLLVGSYEENGQQKYFLPGGTIEYGENILQGTLREITEETGFTDLQFENEVCCLQSSYFADVKNIRKENNAKYLCFNLKSDTKQAKKLMSYEKDHSIVWVKLDEFVKIMTDTYSPFLLDMIKKYVMGNGAYTQKGVLIDSGDFSKLSSDEAIKKMQVWLENHNIGGVKVNYKMQERVFSRQRYRGEPFPVLRTESRSHEEQGSRKIIPLDEKDLPLLLPDVENYEPTGTEEGPLANITDWVNITLPDGTQAKRETNTMPGRAGSSRYWLRYMDPNNDTALVGKDKEKYRGNVDVYVGGAEHITRHIIYGRFWNKFLFDIGAITKDEPFQEYHYVGLIMGEDGRKMSKRRGNVVNPDDIINEFGTDVLRAYEMFMGPFDQAIAWSTNGIKGIKKFLDKIIALKDKIPAGSLKLEAGSPGSLEKNIDQQTITLLNQTIKKIGEDIDGFRFNTAISQLMIFVNHLTDCSTIHKKTFEDLIILVSPFAPHLAEELREQLGNEYSLFTKATWPTYNEKYLVADTVTIAVQVNGKVRGTITISKEADESEVMKLAKADEIIATRIIGEPKKVIYVPGKILNIVV